MHVVFADNDQADGHCVETAHVKVVFCDGSSDKPDILDKLMMKSDLPVLKMNETNRRMSSEGTIDEPDFCPIQESSYLLQTTTTHTCSTTWCVQTQSRYHANHMIHCKRVHHLYY